jgi:hypothetical protein
LADALSGASSGDCVVLPEGTSSSALSVPSGVHLTAQTGHAASLQSSGAAPVVTLAAGASLSGVSITSAAGIGVLINGHAQLTDVTVDHASTVGIVAWCEEDCHTEPGSTLTDVEVTHSGVGLWARGSIVTVEQGRFANNEGFSLGTGYGVVASDGASLTLNGTHVEANQELGVLVDGALGTTASLSQVTVKDNLGRGIWAQGLTGSSTAPKLTLDGCTLDNNTLAGIGARGSTGIKVTGGRIANTRLGLAQTSIPGVTVMVGDGVGVFESTGQIAMSQVTVDSNQRAQLLVDQGGAGVSFQNGTITAASGQLGVVVQHTTVTVDAPNITMPAAGMELSISAPTVAVPVR